MGQSEHAEMLAWHRNLIRVRRATACLNNGEPRNARVSYNQQEMWLRMDRGSIAVLCNLAESGQSLPLPSSSELVLASSSEIRIEDDKITLPPDTVAILRMNRAAGDD